MGHLENWLKGSGRFFIRKGGCQKVVVPLEVGVAMQNIIFYSIFNHSLNGGSEFLGGLKFNVKFNVKCAERLNSPPFYRHAFPTNIWSPPFIIFEPLTFAHFFKNIAPMKYGVNTNV